MSMEMGREISEVKMRDYRATARARRRQQQVALERRFAQARQAAFTAAQVLRSEFGSQRVTLFGSTAQQPLFHAHSDIDLAVWGLADAVYYRAVARLLDVCAPFDVHLVIMEQAPACLRERVRREGISL